MSRICSRIVGMRNRKHQLTTLGTAADAEPWPSRKFAVLPSRSQNLDCRFEDACSRLPWFEYHLCWAPRLDGSAGFVRMSLVQKQLEWFERTAFFGPQQFETCPMWGAKNQNPRLDSNSVLLSMSAGHGHPDSTVRTGSALCFCGQLREGRQTGSKVTGSAFHITNR